jgi:GAF domain-containing protein
MLGSASTEFIALCQSQVLLLTQTLGASSTVIYLAEQSSDLSSPTLVPLVAYPDNADVWRGQQSALSTMDNALPASPQGVDTTPEVPVVESTAGKAAVNPSCRIDAFSEGAAGAHPTEFNVFYGAAEATLPAQGNEGHGAAGQPLILPLAYEGVVLGVIVSTRDTPPWNREDYQQAERVARSLAVACVMDQRNQWLQSQLQQRQLTQADQSQTFHDLLHQFRNPLTALQTFGKLLLKRMQPDDPNRPIAEGILRESGRLGDLAQTFDQAVAQGDADLAETTDPPLEQLLLPDVSEASEALPDAAMLPSPPLVGHSSYHSLGRTLDLAPGHITEVVSPTALGPGHSPGPAHYPAYRYTVGPTRSLVLTPPPCEKSSATCWIMPSNILRQVP